MNTIKAGGADEVILEVDGKVSQEVMRITNGKGVDKCIELVGGSVFVDTCAGVGPEGVISMVGCVGGEWTIKDFDYMVALAPHKVCICFSWH